jgi:phosphohistidine swiveling domain-containing protein
MSAIVSFDQQDAVLETVGGKGLNLMRLARAGMPVPPGFVVSTDAYQAFVRANRLDERIRELWSAASGQPLSTAAAPIRAAFENGAFPPGLSAAIAAAYDALCAQAGQADLPVAVRSSATAEDLADASFAGQQDTYLNVCGAPAVLDAIKRCFGSLWTERAIAYRERQGLEPLAARLAVVVQQMVFASAAGVAFTANPLSGDAHQLVIDATWGLGEALVSGLVTPDHVVVDKRSGARLELVVADKASMIVATPGGTAEQPTPRGQRRARVLRDEQIRILADLGARIENLYGRPQDLEWCLAGDQLYILQARPITTLPDEPVAWDAPGLGQWLHGGGTFEMITEPISPLFETFLLPIFVQAIAQMIAGFGLADALPDPPYAVVNAHIYLSLKLRLRPWHLLGVLRDVNSHMRSWEDQQSEQEHYRRTVAGQAEPPVSALSGAALRARMDALGQAAMRYWLQIMKLVQVIYRKEKGFTDFYNRRARRTGDPGAEVFLRGQKILPWEAECGTYELAQLAQRLDGVAGALRADPGTALISLRDTPAGREFLAALEQHLARYGHQLASFDLRLPTLADDPRPVLVAAQAFLNGNEPPAARRERLAAERDQAAATVLARLAPRDQRTFRRLLDEAQSAARTREDALFDVGLGWTGMHRCALELGRRAAQAGALREAQDVFWLRLDELQALAAALDHGQGAGPLSELVDERRRLDDAWSRVEPPYLLPVGSRPGFWWGWVFPTPELQRHPDAHTLVGLGVSPGKITATARVIKRLEDMDQLNAGEILVAHTTTPAWTPLFARAAGLVTDLGGPLAHGSIVAREYGIPAVMGTGDATRRIRSGQSITVYGSEGRVRLA